MESGTPHFKMADTKSPHTQAAKCLFNSFLAAETAPKKHFYHTLNPFSPQNRFFLNP